MSHLSVIKNLHDLFVLWNFAQKPILKQSIWTAVKQK